MNGGYALFHGLPLRDDNGHVVAGPIEAPVGHGGDQGGMALAQAWIGDQWAPRPSDAAAF
jgi:hypothetical protein